MIPISIITSNPGKLREFEAALRPLGFEVLHRPEEVDEIQADTLEEVVLACMAELRGRDLTNFVLDDSGLFIDALKGFPGVYSAYALKTLGCAGVLKLLEGRKDRGAHFECCIGCSLEGAGDFTVRGRADGQIGHALQGGQGFGFDPIFLPQGGSRTFAEMDLEEKNEISHRGKAIKNLVSQLQNRMGSVHQ
jgi:XTP/dITP diphosphohydrolase